MTTPQIEILAALAVQHRQTAALLDALARSTGDDDEWTPAPRQATAKATGGKCSITGLSRSSIRRIDTIRTKTVGSRLYYSARDARAYLQQGRALI